MKRLTYFSHLISTNHSTQSFTGEVPDETTIHSTQSLSDEIPDETTIHSTQSFNTIIHR